MNKVKIGEEELQIEYKKEPHTWQKNTAYVKDTPFDGHRVLWGFSYTPKNYLKQSNLSGNEYRKGGSIKFFRNNICVYEEFCRETEWAILKTAALYTKLIGFEESFGFHVLSEGQEVSFKGRRGKIIYVFLDQGSIVIEFPEGDTVKEDYLAPSLNWFPDCKELD